MGSDWLLRVVQYKMILKPNPFPIQDDPEKVETGVGELRQDAIANAECRRTLSGPDQRVSKGQLWNRIQWAEPSRTVRLDSTRTHRARIRPSRQEAEGADSRLPWQDQWTQYAASRAADSEVPSLWEAGGEGISATAVCPEVHGRRCGSVGSSGSSTRAAERAGNAPYPEAR